MCVRTTNELSSRSFGFSFVFLFCRKVFTAFATAGVGIQSVFFSNFDEIQGFEGKEHIFTHVQRDMRDWVDKTIYGIDISSNESTTTTTTTNDANTNRKPKI